MPDLQGRRRKVAIVGFCETSRDAVPYNDPDTEVWGLNRGYMFMRRYDRWFEMHGENIYESQERRPGRHTEFLKAFPGPVYMHTARPDIPNSVAFPLKAIADDIGPFVHRLGRMDGGKWVDTAQQRDTTGEPYLSSSIAYEIALAIHERFDEIQLYGIDLNTESEYAWQKPGVEFLLGVAAGRGINVVLPDNCPLLKGTLYGRSFMSPKPEVMGYEQMRTRRMAQQADMERARAELNQMQGALRELTRTIEQMVPGLDHEAQDQRRKRMEQAMQRGADRLQMLVGAINENIYWQHQTMPGQDPAEAMEQLSTLDAEGPITEIAVLQRPEAVFAGALDSIAPSASG